MWKASGHAGRLVRLSIRLAPVHKDLADTTAGADGERPV
jgi:hypothetical protein